MAGSRRFFLLLVLLFLAFSASSLDWERADPGEEIVLTGEEYNLIMEELDASEMKSSEAEKESIRLGIELEVLSADQENLDDMFVQREGYWQEREKEARKRGTWTGIAIGGGVVIVLVGVPLIIVAAQGALN